MEDEAGKMEFVMSIMSLSFFSYDVIYLLCAGIQAGPASGACVATAPSSALLHDAALHIVGYHTRK